MNILAVGCHPDDVEIACAGTLAKCVKRGDRVTVCHVSNGNLGHVEIPPDTLAVMRKNEAKRAGALAGIAPEEVITCRPADNIAPELETYKEQFKDIAKSEEDVLSLALFPQVASKFLAWRDGPHEAPAQPAEAPKAPPADPNAVRELFVEYKF